MTMMPKSRRSLLSIMQLLAMSSFLVWIGIIFAGISRHNMVEASFAPTRQTRAVNDVRWQQSSFSKSSPMRTNSRVVDSLPSASPSSPFQLFMARKKKQEVAVPHPPDTAPPKSKLNEAQMAETLNTEAEALQLEEISALLKSMPSSDQDLHDEGAKLEEISNLLAKLDDADEDMTEEMRLQIQQRTKELAQQKKRQKETPPFFFLDGVDKGEDVKSSFESLEGGMDDYLQRMPAQTKTKGKRIDMKRIGSSLSSTLAPVTTNVVNPLLQGQVESEVSEQAIKGAILAGVVITALAGKGAAVTGAAGLGAAYAAITAGPVGQAVRAIGGLTWDISNQAMDQVRNAEREGKVDAALRTMAEFQLPETWEELAEQRAYLLSQAAEKAFYERQRELNRRSMMAYRLTLQAQDRIIRAKLEVEEEAHRTEQARLEREHARLAEQTRLAAAEARVAEDSRKVAEEKRIKEEMAAAVEEQERLLEAERLEAEAKKLEEEALLLEQETQRLEQQAEKARREQAEEARIAAEAAAQAEEARLAAEAEAQRLEAEAKAALEEETRRLKEEEAKVQALKEEEANLQAEEERLSETARLAEEERLAKEEEEKLLNMFNSPAVQPESLPSNTNEFIDADTDAMEQFDEEDWEASIRAAQESIDGSIAGLGEALSVVDDDAKADWDRASQMAQGLGGKTQQRPPDDVDVVTDGDELLDVVSDDLDFEALGLAARQAVEAFEDQAQTDDSEKQAQRQQWQDEMVTDSKIDVEEEDDLYEDEDEDYIDYADMTVAELKVELKSRGLPAYGRKKDLVNILEEDDADQEEEESFDDDELDYFDSEINTDSVNGAMAEDGGSATGAELFEELARAAVKMVESGVDEGEQDDDDNDDEGMEKEDWASYTVAELRTELRNRDLPTRGNKAELVALLEESDVEAERDDDVDDIEAIGLAAREAVENMVFAPASVDDEPSDEALWEIEQDAIVTEVEEELGDDDFENMTVTQLKDELRGRGLRLSGKKSELIERLRASSMST